LVSDDDQCDLDTLSALLDEASDGEAESGISQPACPSQNTNGSSTDGLWSASSSSQPPKAKLSTVVVGDEELDEDALSALLDDASDFEGNYLMLLILNADGSTHKITHLSLKNSVFNVFFFTLALVL
jgi:hypothetical protein